MNRNQPEWRDVWNFIGSKRAIEVFIQMLEVDSETVETHLALGNLFRRRGEVDRAIRIHQNIIARPTLNRNQRSLALYELGQDYMKRNFILKISQIKRNNTWIINYIIMNKIFFVILNL